MVRKTTGVIEPIVDKKIWYKSKTKMGAILLGTSVIFGASAAFVNGQDLFTSVTTGLSGLGLILAAFGIRNKLDELKF